MADVTLGYRRASARTTERRGRLSLLGQGLAWLVLAALFWPAQAAAQEDPELAALLAEERGEADRLRRRGDLDGARSLLEELLDEEPDDPDTRSYLARVELDVSLFDRARELAEEALQGGPAAQRRGALVLFERARELASAESFDALAERLGSLAIRFEGDAELLYARGRAALALGRRESAFADFEAAAAADAAEPSAWLARARAHRALGDLTPASRDLVEADRAARAAGGREAEILAELAGLYFEADGETASTAGSGRAPGELYRQALSINPHSEAAGLGLFELGRFNWRRQSAPPESYLEPVFAVRPNSVDALLAQASGHLDDGQLPRVRHALKRLDALAPARRDVRTLAAALAWVEHRREESRAALARLAAEDPADSAPERVVGTHLLELYRFAEALPFLEAAVARDAADYEAWTQVGRARANTGDTKGGLEALQRATSEAAGRRNAWRSNQRQVLDRLDRLYVEHVAGELTFAWMPDEAPVLERYLVPFYEDARRELEERYGRRTGPVRIEVYRRHADFSVRSTGFEGFPALGVCFGPVVTAVSPIAEIRGQFSWARTSFHEFTHVVHLALSNNRCPRWITEGLATWEEERKSRAWSRNMRRDLVDARANGDLIPLRELNRAFRGPRVLFGYYQGGLLCRMLIESHGFPSMVRLLEAFDRGLDLDQSMAEVFGLTPDEIDRNFAAFVDRELEGLHLEPRWREERVALTRLSLGRRPPTQPAERAAWRSAWVDVGFAAWGAGRRVDAEEALRLCESDLGGGADRVPARAAHLRGVIAAAGGDVAKASQHWRDFLAQGGEDFRVRMTLGELALKEGEIARAREHFERAEASFPGFPEAQLAAELGLAKLLESEGDREGAVAARRRWLSYNADDGELRLELARWYAERGEHADAAALFAEANEVDPFQRQLHSDWGDSLAALGRNEEALREFEVALLVPAELEKMPSEPLSAAERADLLGRSAAQLVSLGRLDEARARAQEALALDPACKSALGALERIP